MKKIFGILAGAMVLASCGKENEFSNDFASVVVLNASPNATGTAAMHVYVDTLIKTGSALGYRANSGYLGVLPGTRLIETRSVTNATIKYVNRSIEFANRTASTLVVYDTLATATGTLRSVVIPDDLSLPAANTVKARFLHLAQNAPAVDITLVRTNVVTPDSVTLTNRTYIGNSPNGAALAPFAAIPLGTYTIRVKAAGTQTVVLQTTGVALNAVNGIYTLYAAGTAAGAPLTANALRHN
ncbi:MAG: DUF4397 domain-containing protein [Sphingobacteriia bacterium]|nr:MAG: DUF4397 domain-containing protein [Sphingobacteriia bacterium]